VLPSVIWLAAAAAGQWYCRRALAPVAEMAAQARAIKPGDAEVRIAVATSGDELADLGGAMNDLLSRLFDSLERQRRFAGDAAHQLRTPLTVLLGQIEVALRRERPVEEYKATLDVLREQTEELRQLIESLLFLARAESDAAPLDQQELSFDDWLPHYLERWRDHPRRDDLQVEVAPLLHLKTSPALLAQLLDNLLSNAFKYSAAGTPVKLSCAASGQGIAISVADRGMGISPDDRAAILRPFYRATAARQSGAPGTGLGLAICDCIVRTLGGKLDWHSEVGHGTTFTVVL
jgi:signal transduction histidine kinase